MSEVGQVSRRPRARAGRAAAGVVARLARTFPRAATLLRAPRFHRGSLVAVGGTAVLMLAASALVPEPAHAGWIEDAVQRMVERIFGVDAKSFTDGFLVWLIGVPSFIGDPARARAGGNLAELAQTTSGIAFGLMGAVMTFAVLRHWLSGLSELGGDGSELLTGIIQTVGAALLILAWPWIFVNAAHVSNQITAVLVNEDDIVALTVIIVSALTITAIFSAGVALIFGILIMLAAVVLLLGLAAMKITLSAALAVLFAGMPLAIMLWPLPAMSWIPRLAIRTTATLMLIPIVWALILATAIAVTFDSLTLKGGGGLLDQVIIEPLTALALLWLMITIPRLLLRIASLGAVLPGSGRVGQTMSWMGGQFAYQTVSRHVPESFGGKKEWAQHQTQQRQASTDPSGGPGAARPADAGAARDAARSTLGTTAAAAATGGAGAMAGGAAAAGGAGAAASGAATPGANAGAADPGAAAGRTSGAAGAGATEARQAGAMGWRNAAGTFHDGWNLPANPGAGRTEQGRAAVADAARSLRGQDQEQREFGGHVALDKLGEAGYADATMAYTQSHSPSEVSRRMADASTADGLSAETSGAFIAWGALDPETRQTVMDEREAAGRDAQSGAGGDFTGEPAVQSPGPDPEGGEDGRSGAGTVPDYPPSNWRPRSPSGESVDPPSTATAPPRDVTDLSDGGSPDGEE